ncbi:MAG: hypothetical protein ACI4V1_05585 [Eubacteriales bacterium]
MAKSNKMTNSKANKMTSLGKNEAGRIVLFRILLIVLADLVMGSLFDFVKAEATRELAFHLNVHPILKYAFGVLFVLSVIYFIVTLVRKVDTSTHLMTPEMLLGLTFFLFASALFYDHFRNTPFLFYTLMVIGSVLYAVYYIYTILLYRR